MHRSQGIVTDKLVISDSINEFLRDTSIAESEYDFPMSIDA